MSALRFGLLGTGPWASRTHAPALAGHPDVEFAGVWGRRPEAARRLAEEFGVRAYADADALIADVDAVAIALPPAVQAPLAVAAARAGRLLLLDKPVGAGVADAAAVADAVDEAGVASVVFFTLRFDAARAAWIEQQAATGGWFTGRADWYGAVFPPDEGTAGGTGSAGTAAGPADTAGGVVDGAGELTPAGVSPYAASPWRGEKGGLWDVGPHALSVLLPVLGDVTEVHAVRGPRDAVHLTLRHVSGASSTSLLTLGAPPAGSGVAVEFRGAHGISTLPDGLAGSPVASLARAVDALVAGAPHPCDARFGLRVNEILSAAQSALR